MDETETYAVAGLVAPHPLAAAAGLDVLIEGGSVVEAAIAAAAVSAVVVPQRNGIGGDALWLIREPGPRGRVRVLDARGVAAQDATLARYRGRDAVPPHGPDAVLTVPGTVAGWAAAHALAGALGGRLPLSRLLSPALSAARDGVEVTPQGEPALALAASALADVPGFAAAFLPDGKVPPAGTRLPRAVLAATLDFLVHSGLGQLYRGDVGRELGADLEELSCPLGRDDLRRGEARWRRPGSLDLGRRTLDVAANRSGLGLALALGLFDGFRDMRPDGFDHWHGLIETAKRAEHLIDAAVAAGLNPADLLDADELLRQSLAVDRGRAGAGPANTPPLLAEEGVWIGAVDRDGGAVSLVQSLGGAFGSGVVSGRTGLLLGNRGSGLALDARRGPLLEPRARAPLVSIPALEASRDGRVASLGAVGQGAGLAALQVAARVGLGEMWTAALAAPRFAFGTVAGEPEAAVLIGDDAESGLVARLRAAGHRLERRSVAAPMACIVSRRPDARVEAVTGGDEAGFCAGV